MFRQSRVLVSPVAPSTRRLALSGRARSAGSVGDVASAPEACFPRRTNHQVQKRLHRVCQSFSQKTRRHHPWHPAGHRTNPWRPTRLRGVATPSYTGAPRRARGRGGPVASTDSMVENRRCKKLGKTPSTLASHGVLLKWSPHTLARVRAGRDARVRDECAIESWRCGECSASCRLASWMRSARVRDANQTQRAKSADDRHTGRNKPFTVAISGRSPCLSLPLNFPSTGETHTRGGIDANASTAWISSARKVRIPPLLPVQPRISESLGTFSTKRLIQNPPSPSLTSLLPNSNPTGTRVVHTR